MRRPLLLLTAALAACGESPTNTGPREDPYLQYVTVFANTLLAVEHDPADPAARALWPGVIDATDLSVPTAGVPALNGVRDNDRAVGGSNLYHDVVLLRAFVALSGVSGDPKYEAATQEYVRAYLRLAQSPGTGLLAWGEHLYYDFARGEVARERSHHELIAWTPPWDLLWSVDPLATTNAISGLRHHYLADDPAARFDRHAVWVAPGTTGASESWIKHTGLFAFSFMFLYGETGDPLWLDWSRGSGSMYWIHRNPETGLTPGKWHPNPERTVPPNSGLAQLSYWLLKAYDQNRQESDLLAQGLSFLHAFDEYFYDPATDSYHRSVSMEGVPVDRRPTPVWGSGYAQVDMTHIGRMAAYAARTGDARSRAIAERAGRMVVQRGVPRGLTAENYGFAINLMLDLHDLTQNPAYLQSARAFAAKAMDELWVGSSDRGLFVRVANDPYYEALHGIGDLVSGLLRLHLRVNGLPDPPGADWTF